MIIPPENLEDIAKKFGFGKYAKQKQQLQEFEQDESYYIIHNVQYRGLPRTVKITKNLLDYGYQNTQDDWNAKAKNKIPDSQLYHAMIKKLYNCEKTYTTQISQIALLKEITAILADDFKENWMTTSTRVKYKTHGKDEITHQYGTQNEETKLTRIPIRTEILITPGSGIEDVLEAVLGDNDLLQIEKIYTWLSKSKPYLFPKDFPKDNNYEATVIMGNASYRTTFKIHLQAHISQSWRARGIFVEELIPSKFATHSTSNNDFY